MKEYVRCNEAFEIRQQDGSVLKYLEGAVYEVGHSPVCTIVKNPVAKPPGYKPGHRLALLRDYREGLFTKWIPRKGDCVLFGIHAYWIHAFSHVNSSLVIEWASGLMKSVDGLESVFPALGARPKCKDVVSSDIKVGDSVVYRGVEVKAGPLHFGRTCMCVGAGRDGLLFIRADGRNYVVHVDNVSKQGDKVAPRKVHEEEVNPYGGLTLASAILKHNEEEVNPYGGLTLAAALLKHNDFTREREELRRQERADAAAAAARQEWEDEEQQRAEGDAAEDRRKESV